MVYLFIYLFIITSIIIHEKQDQVTRQRQETVQEIKKTAANKLLTTNTSIFCSTSLFFFLKEKDYYADPNLTIVF